MKPSIQQVKKFDFYNTPEVPTFKAGYLVEGNGTWRNQRPVVDRSKCIKCMQCYLYCPDGAIDQDVNIDYDFCKGCGICTHMCRPGALSMHPEHEGGQQ